MFSIVQLLIRGAHNIQCLFTNEGYRSMFSIAGTIPVRFREWGHTNTTFFRYFPSSLMLRWLSEKITLLTQTGLRVEVAADGQDMLSGGFSGCQRHGCWELVLLVQRSYTMDVWCVRETTICCCCWRDWVWVERGAMHGITREMLYWNWKITFF